MKVKAREYALDELTKMKAGYSKMDNIYYPRLEMQHYLKNEKINPENAKLIIAYRTRLAYFTENLQSPYGPKHCPLCFTHLDNQQGAFKFPKILPSLGKGKYEELFLNDILLYLIKNLKTVRKVLTELEKSQDRKRIAKPWPMCTNKSAASVTQN